jgi:hypothetical protein
MTIAELKESIALLERHLPCCRESVRKAITELRQELAKKQNQK